VKRMTESSMRRWRGLFLRAGGAALGVLVLGAGCAQIIGIEETKVSASAGTGGMGGQTNNSPGGGGSTSNGGRGGSTAQQGGSGGAAGTGGAVGMGGTSTGACTNDEARCGAAGREQCVGGVWQAMACPVTQPACEGAGTCVLRGPVGVQVAVTLTTGFYIDATEVTFAQYTQFVLAKNGDVSGQPPECAWNTEYFAANRAPDADDLPIYDVDWCDARAYCEWAGKQLCGRIAGGAIPTADIFTATENQWFLACGGPSESPYFDTVNGNGECNAKSGFTDLAPVASIAPGSTVACQSSRYPGLFDMIGNVGEWVDSCTPAGDAGAEGGRDDVCLLLGGGIYSPEYYCDAAAYDARRDDVARSYGFRCCSGLTAITP
jgi:formylglycine-generating enzyme